MTQEAMQALREQVCRHKGTEPPHSSPLLHEKRSGRYLCACCGTALFSSETKFDSGSGWPSFYAPLSRHVLRYEEDFSHGMIRTEVKCARCDAHLGHLFDDGAPPTGLRYCINGIALEFVPDRTEAEKADASLGEDASSRAASALG